MPALKSNLKLMVEYAFCQSGCPEALTAWNLNTSFVDPPHIIPSALSEMLLQRYYRNLYSMDNLVNHMVMER